MQGTGRSREQFGEQRQRSSLPCNRRCKSSVGFPQQRHTDSRMVTVEKSLRAFWNYLPHDVPLRFAGVVVPKAGEPCLETEIEVLSVHEIFGTEPSQTLKTRRDGSSCRHRRRFHLCRRNIFVERRGSQRDDFGNNLRRTRHPVSDSVTWGVIEHSSSAAIRRC